MRSDFLFAAAAGALSGGLLLLTLLGGPAAVLVGYLAPLPLFLAGLGLGAVGAAIAGVIGALMAAFSVGVPIAVLFVLSFAVPVVVLCRHALLSRPAADGSTEWYPLGQLAVWLCTIAALAFALVVVGFAIAGQGLLAALQALVSEFATAFQVEIDAETGARIAEYAPGVLAISWQIQVIVNGALAQGLLLRFGRNLRPQADIAGLTLPKALLPAFAAAMALALADGSLGMIGKTLAAIALVPYFLLGLGFIHRLVRSWQARYFVLVLFYGLVLPLFWPVPLIVIGLGLFEHAGQWRRRKGGGPTDRKED